MKRLIFAMLMTFSLLSIAGFAQTRGSLTGIVVDPVEALIPATVTVKNVARGEGISHGNG